MPDTFRTISKENFGGNFLRIKNEGGTLFFCISFMIQAARESDMGNEELSLKKTKDGSIQLATIPADSVITFTASGGGSLNTYKATRELYFAMKEDNKANIQIKTFENNKSIPVFNNNSTQSRLEDGEKQQEMIVEYYSDVKIYMPFNDSFLEFFPNGKSPNTYNALVNILIAMGEDGGISE